MMQPAQIKPAGGRPTNARASTAEADASVRRANGGQGWLCPTCGSKISDRPSPQALIAATPLGLVELKVLEPLLKAFGRFVTPSQIVNRAFRLSRKEVKNHRALGDAIGRINQKLLTRGLVVERVRERNGRPLRYRLGWAIEFLRCERCGAVYPADRRAPMCACGGRLVSTPAFEQLDKEAA